GIRDFHVTGVQTCAVAISLAAQQTKLGGSSRVKRWRAILLVMLGCVLALAQGVHAQPPSSGAHLVLPVAAIEDPSATLDAGEALARLQQGGAEVVTSDIPSFGFQ